MQSLVVPGYVFAPVDRPAERPLDVVVMFKGFPAYSVLLRGIRAEDSLDSLAVSRPSPPLDFVRCDATPLNR
jgi:hypothetical protein